ncbi:MAG TPA: ribonuclease H [Acidimicrobiales bacterium]|nr:ribonuclease H [Acidimicrobiales bacterium]
MNATTPTIVYTDGACLGNPGPGGWAWAVPTPGGDPGEWFASGPDPWTTNQRMEITAVLEALGAVAGPVEVMSDSTYVVNCFRQRWWAGWEARNWRNARGRPVANQDLWRPLVDQVRGRGQVRFAWVKAHAGDPVNEFVDRLAVEAATSQSPRRGS